MMPDVDGRLDLSTPSLSLNCHSTLCLCGKGFNNWDPGTLAYSTSAFVSIDNCLELRPSDSNCIAVRWVGSSQLDSFATCIVESIRVFRSSLRKCHHAWRVIVHQKRVQERHATFASCKNSTPRTTWKSSKASAMKLVLSLQSRILMLTPFANSKIGFASKFTTIAPPQCEIILVILCHFSSPTNTSLKSQSSSMASA